LDAALEDGDLEHIVLAVKNVAEAHSNSNNATHETPLVWENLDQLLIEGRTPTLPEMALLLSQLGLKLSVTIKSDQAA
jgi:DNA-binding phage protein